MRRSSIWIIAGTLAVTGCGHQKDGELYRAERDLWQASRAASRLEVNPDLVGKNDLLRVADRYRAVGRRYLESMRSGAEPEGQTAKSIAHVGARAHLSAARLYMQAGDLDTARELAILVRERMSWSDEASRSAQIRLVEVLGRGDDIDAISSELWRLGDDYAPVAQDGEIHNAVFNAPMNVVRLAELRRDTVLARTESQRALEYYERISGEWTGRTPALLSDLHRSTLLEGRGDWRTAARVLEAVLADADSLEPEELSRVAFGAGRIYARDRRDPRKAIDLLTRAREVPLGTGAAYEATMELASLMSEEGRPAEAVDLYRHVVEGLSGDAIRAPLAQLKLARELERAGRWDEATREYRVLQASYPQSVEAMEVPFALAAHYRRTGADELAVSTLGRAESDLREIIARRKGTPEAYAAHRYLVRSLAERQEWKAAVDAMIAFSSEYPGQSESAEALLEAAAISKERLRDPDRSGELLRMVEEFYPNTPFAERAADFRERNGRSPEPR